MAFSNLQRCQAEEIHSRIARGEKVFVVDVRSLNDRIGDPTEIPGAHWVPLSHLIPYTTQIPRDASIATYCT